MGLFGREAPVPSRGTIEIDSQGDVVGLAGGADGPLVRQADGQVPSLDEQRHAEILLHFERGQRALERAEQAQEHCLELAASAAAAVKEASDVVAEQRRLLRRVAEGHI